MPKSKQCAILLVILMLINFAGCAEWKQTQRLTDNSNFPPSSTDEPQTAEKEKNTVSTETAEWDYEPKNAETEKSEPTQTTEEKTEKPVLTESAVPTECKPYSESQPTTENRTEQPKSEETAKSDQTTEIHYTQPSADAVEKAVAKYINGYRVSQGDSTAVILPGLTEVARYRAKQLITNFSHDEDTDACTVLKYGEFVDMTQYGLPESANYYQGFNREAIAKGNWTGTADEIGQKIAEGFKNSQGHWAYTGSSEYEYMAVGIAFNPADSHWYCCVCMSSKNYGG